MAEGCDLRFDSSDLREVKDSLCREISFAPCSLANNLLNITLKKIMKNSCIF